MIVTVTTNAALDRTLTVPVFQIGFRHRSSDVLVLAGGKGINVARTLKILEVPVKRILLGHDPEKVASRESLANPQALDWFVRWRELSRA